MEIVCIWQQEKYVKFMLNEMVKYSNLHDAALISKEKAELMGKMNTEPYTVTKDGLTIGKSHYLTLLEVFELTIAY